MCWRILRINGDGSIKLILEDKDTTCNSDSFTGNWALPFEVEGVSSVTGNFGYTKYGNKKLTTSDGLNKNPSYRYLMDYLNPETGVEKAMPTVFKDFQQTLVTSYETKLKADKWCFSDAGYSKISEDEFIYEPLERVVAKDEIIIGNLVYYDSSVRLRKNPTGAVPTLQCNGTVYTDWGDDNKTPMYVGAITADEMTYAGGVYGVNNQNYFLINDKFMNNELGSEDFWTMSPAYYSGTYYDRAYLVDYTGALANDMVNKGYAFRPLITLATGVEYFNGNGEITSPYTIK